MKGQLRLLNFPQSNSPQQFAGERLVGEAYFAKFYQDWEKAKDPRLLKFERRQSFQEPDSESWKAFAQGDWQKALELLEAFYEKPSGNEYPIRRVRVVEEPISPYLQWELQALQMLNVQEENTQIVVIDSSQIVEYEQDGSLPEIVVLGQEILYQVIYNHQGLYQEALRFTNGELIDKWQQFIDQLLSTGEDIEPFFHREIAKLAPPLVRTRIHNG